MILLHEKSGVVNRKDFPIRFKSLNTVPSIPEKLFWKGSEVNWDNHFLSIVGSRKHTSYAKDALEKIISGLRGYPFTIVSGLAIGVDSLAHELALKYNLTTIAIPGSGLGENNLYPRNNLELAKKIINSGGTLLSEYPDEKKSMIHYFPERNRIMAGLSHAILVVEAGDKSGTLITAKFGVDYNKDILAIPGSIFSPLSYGPNNLIKQGAVPVTSAEDILKHFHYDSTQNSLPFEEKYKEATEDEIVIIELLREPREKDFLLNESGLDISKLNITLSMMEIKGYSEEREGCIRLI